MTSASSDFGPIRTRIGLLSSKNWLTLLFPIGRASQVAALVIREPDESAGVFVPPGNRAIQLESQVDRGPTVGQPEGNGFIRAQLDAFAELIAWQFGHLQREKVDLDWSDGRRGKIACVLAFEVCEWRHRPQTQHVRMSTAVALKARRITGSPLADYVRPDSSQPILLRWILTQH